MANWSNLPQDLIISVARRVVSMEDFVAFGAVCRSWGLAATKENFTGGLADQVPFLLLPEKEEAVSVIREVYNLSKGKNYKLNLPEAKKKLCYSSLGWLITVQDLKVNLLHPLNHAQIKLPDFKVSEKLDSPHINKFVLSSSPSWISDYIIMALYNRGKLAFCRPRHDKHWTNIILQLMDRICDIAYYKGQFYVVDYDSIVHVCDIEDPKQVSTRIVVRVMSRTLRSPLIRRESGGSLLVVFCCGIWNALSYPVFRVLKVSFSRDDRPWQSQLDSEVKNLGNTTLFLGDNNSSFSFQASNYSGCETNCIYFCKHLLPNKHQG